MLQVVQLDHLPFSWPASGALEVPTALLWMLTFQDNHGHLLGEHGPSMHTVLCTYLGRHARLRAGMRALQSGTITYRSDSCRLNPELCPIMTQARWGCRSGSSRRYGMCPAEGQTYKQWACIWGRASS